MVSCAGDVGAMKWVPRGDAWPAHLKKLGRWYFYVPFSTLLPHALPFTQLEDWYLFI